MQRLRQQNIPHVKRLELTGVETLLMAPPEKDLDVSGNHVSGVGSHFSVPCSDQVPLLTWTASEKDIGAI